MGFQYAIGRGLDICFDRLHDAGEADLSLRTRRRTGFAMHSPHYRRTRATRTRGSADGCRGDRKAGEKLPYRCSKVRATRREPRRRAEVQPEQAKPPVWARPTGPTGPATEGVGRRSTTRSTRQQCHQRCLRDTHGCGYPVRCRIHHSMRYTVNTPPPPPWQTIPVTAAATPGAPRTSASLVSMFPPS
jgi:hypothetical protein